MKYSVFASIGSPAIRSHHSFGMACCARPSLLMLLLSLFLFSGRALADSTATAYFSLGWSAASFSGTVSPAPLPNNTYSTLAEAYGWLEVQSTVVQSSFKGGDDLVAGWGSAASTVHFGPEDYAISTATNTALTALSTSTGGNSLSVGQTERSGSILSTDGNITISIPYSFSVAITNDASGACCYSARDLAWIYLFSGNNRITSSIDYEDQFGAVGNYNSQGVLSLSLGDLQPGSYVFDFGVASETTFVPEPSTFLMLGTGLFGLAGILVGKRFA